MDDNKIETAASKLMEKGNSDGKPLFYEEALIGASEMTPAERQRFLDDAD